MKFIALDEVDVRQLLAVINKIYYELNTIRARDGVPYQVEYYLSKEHSIIGKSSVDEDYFSSLIDDLGNIIQRFEKYEKELSR